MENPRPEKVAVVDEVKERLSASDATVLTDYRGIDVPGMAELRRSLHEAGGDVKIYKNTLVRFAAQQLGLDIEDMLVGPTALAFVEAGEDGTGDPVLVAKALRDFAKTNENLQIKGGLLGDRLLSADEIDQLAKIAPRDELLARFAGGLAAPMQQMASLLQALPRGLAYGIAALIDEKGGPVAVPEPEAAEAEAAEPEADASTGDAAPEADAESTQDSSDEAADTATENAEASAPADDSDSTDDSAAEASADEDSAPEASADEDSAAEDTASDSSETDDSDSEES